MAKSIKSKSKRKFRAIKREQVFGPRELERTIKLAALQKQAASVDPLPVVTVPSEPKQEQKQQEVTKMEIEQQPAETAAKKPMIKKKRKLSKKARRRVFF